MLNRPYQNRVNPLGDIVAAKVRGNLLGNRGCLHDETGKLTRQNSSKPWIYCTTESEVFRPFSINPGEYTRLFFKDEASALAAGHRPCAQCLRPRFKAYREAAEKYLGAKSGTMRAPKIDTILRSQRLNTEPFEQSNISGLPDGVLLTNHGKIWMTENGTLVPWVWGDVDNTVGWLDCRLLTPSLSIGVLKNGFNATSII
ncbi:MAG: hypothetical protein ACSHXY_10730 [Alphaproteobacteria bacterium]